ncbi:MAG: hypothetical protein U1F49_02150 [Rubrivivax sp.]
MDDLHQLDAGAERAQLRQLARRHVVDELQRRRAALPVLRGDRFGVGVRGEQERAHRLAAQRRGHLGDQRLADDAGAAGHRRDEAERLRAGGERLARFVQAGDAADLDGDAAFAALQLLLPGCGFFAGAEPAPRHADAARRVVHRNARAPRAPCSTALAARRAAGGCVFGPRDAAGGGRSGAVHATGGG